MAILRPNVWEMLGSSIDYADNQCYSPRMINFASRWRCIWPVRRFGLLQRNATWRPSSVCCLLLRRTASLRREASQRGEQRVLKTNSTYRNGSMLLLHYCQLSSHCRFSLGSIIQQENPREPLTETEHWRLKWQVLDMSSTSRPSFCLRSEHFAFVHVSLPQEGKVVSKNEYRKACNCKQT